VGAAASGKTTLRRSLLAAGLRAERVVSLDDLRRALRDADVVAGREPRPLQDYTLRALRAAERRQQELLSAGAGYLLDATSLRRRERVAHVRAAHAAGLPAVALLLEALPPDVLAERNARRRSDEVVPQEVLAQQSHRHGLLDAALLEGEGFDVVRVVPRNAAPGPPPAVTQDPRS
jgi:predicted kinase